MKQDITQHFFAISNLDSESQVHAYLEKEEFDTVAQKEQLLELWKCQRRADSNGFLNKPERFIEEQISSGQNDPALFETGIASFKIFPGYEIVRLLGRGGMAMVFEGKKLDESAKGVAIKWLRAGRLSPQAVQRFVNESQILAKLDHPNIVRLVDFGVTTLDQRFLVTELIHGEPLTQFCSQRDLPIEERLGIFIKICDALQYSHDQGIIHRDIKPTNILVEEVGEKAIPKLIDFGLAKSTTEKHEFDSLTQFGQILGTPQYMSPQQAQNGAVVDPKNDVYSLGAVLFELIAGIPPVTSNEILQQGLANIFSIDVGRHESLPSRAILKANGDGNANSTKQSAANVQWQKICRDSLDAIVLKAMAADPSERYDTPRALKEDIIRALSGTKISVWPLRVRRGTIRVFRGLKKAAPIVIAVACLTFIATSFLFRGDTEPTQPPTSNVSVLAKPSFQRQVDLLWASLILRSDSRFDHCEKTLFELGISLDALDNSVFQERLSSLTADEQGSLLATLEVTRFLNKQISEDEATKRLDQRLTRLIGLFPESLRPRSTLDNLLELEKVKSSAGSSLKLKLDENIVISGYQAVLICVELAIRGKTDLLRAYSNSVQQHDLSNYELQNQIGLIRLATVHTEFDESFRAALVLRNNSSSALVGLALAAHARNSVEEEMNLISRARRLAPELLELEGEQIHLQLQQDQSDENFARLVNYVEKNPRNALAASRLGVAYQNRNDLANARIQFERLCELLPLDANSYVALGTVCRLLQDWDAAIAAFRTAAKLSPTLPIEAYRQYAFCHLSIKELDTAEAIAMQGLAIKEDVDCLAMLGRIAIDRGRDLEAIRHLRRALALRPKDSQIRRMLAPALIRTGEIREVIQQYLELTKLESNVADDWYNLSIGYLKEENPTDAIHPGITAFRLEPGNEGNLENALLLVKLCCGDWGLLNEEELRNQLVNNFPHKNLLFEFVTTGTVPSTFEVRDAAGQAVHNTILQIIRQSDQKLVCTVVIGDQNKIQFHAEAGESYSVGFPNSVTDIGVAPVDGSNWEVGPVIATRYVPPIFKGNVKTAVAVNSSNKIVFVSLFHPDSGEAFLRVRVKPGERIEMTSGVGEDWGVCVNANRVESITTIVNRYPLFDQQDRWEFDVGKMAEEK